MVMRTALSVTFGFNFPILNPFSCPGKGFRKVVPPNSGRVVPTLKATVCSICHALSKRDKFHVQGKEKENHASSPNFDKFIYSRIFLPQPRVWRVKLSRMSLKNRASATLVVWTCSDVLLGERNLAKLGALNALCEFFSGFRFAWLSLSRESLLGTVYPLRLISKNVRRPSLLANTIWSRKTLFALLYRFFRCWFEPSRTSC
jgi:hypothetical protein